MPLNSSSRLNTSSGLVSSSAVRSSVSESSTPSACTWCPAARSVEITSYSVRHSSISFSEKPARLSGGTRLECTTTSVRSFFMRAESCSQAQALAAHIQPHQPAQHGPGGTQRGALRTAHVQLQTLATIDRRAQHLVRRVAVNAGRADDGGQQLRLVRAQQR